MASGDPLADRVVLWTRVSVDGDVEVDVDWAIAEDPEDPSCAQPVAWGRATTRAEHDYTVKVDVTRLAPGRIYYYRFVALGVSSPIGRTRTLPLGAIGHVQIAVVSCSNFPYGHFNVYGAVAARDDVDVVVHLGDYIYENAKSPYGDGTSLERGVLPADRECITLQDYRERHASYKGDAQLRAVHARHPFIAIWDDHEIANNAWREGAQNHEPGEGAYTVRRAAAIRAWREWMPVREASDPAQIHRSFRFGDMLELIMLDARLMGRDRQVAPQETATLHSSGRSLLGPEQQRWLFERMRSAFDDAVAWQALGQQVLMTQVRDPSGLPRNTDMWDGYPAARDRVLGFLEELRIGDVVVLTGDIHSSWATELRRDPFAAVPTPALAVELTAPAVSSPTPVDPPDLGVLHASHPHVRWVDMRHRGYLTVRFDRREALAVWHHTDDVATVHTNVPARKAFAIPRGRAALEERGV